MNFKLRSICVYLRESQGVVCDTYSCCPAQIIQNATACQLRYHLFKNLYSKIN